MDPYRAGMKLRVGLVVAALVQAAKIGT